jgi:predicted glycosyltransferase
MNQLPHLNHDRLFKELLSTFFVEFLELFFPQVIAYLEPNSLQFLEFNYRVVQLNRLDWRDFLRQENPVAAALMSKMQIQPQERPQVKAECLRLLATLYHFSKIVRDLINLR